MKQYEVVFSRHCVPQSRIVKADRYEIKPSLERRGGDEIVFYRDDYVVTRENTNDVKQVKEVQP